jgi:hypothetical protein
MAVGFPVKANYVTGEVLTAANMNDLSGTLNTIQSVEYAAGKNKIINGDFNINQRAFSSTTSSATYTFDRWRTDLSGGTVTYSAQTFTPGTAPVVGYESKNFLRIVTSGQSTSGDCAFIEQRIEDVRTFANQTVTLSFWAKASTGTPKVGTTIVQNFGFGGSDIVIAKSGDVTISTSWARYSVTVAISSISGKTVGTGSYLRNMLFTSAGTTLSSYTDIGVQNVTIDIWGVQLEASSTASDFQTATGTLQGELAACRRYYIRFGSGSDYTPYGTGWNSSTSAGQCVVMLPVSMRVEPTSVEYSTLGSNVPGVSSVAITTVTLSTESGQDSVTLTTAASATFTTGFFVLANRASSSAYLALNAEL